MNPPPSDKQSDRERAEAVRRLYHGLDGVVQFMPLLPLLLVMGLWQHVDKVTLLSWCIVAVSVPVWRHILVRRYKASQPGPSQAARWGRRVTWSAFADGLMWGTAGIAFYVPDALPQQLILLAMIIGIPAGSIFTTSWWPATEYAFSFPAVGFTAIGLATRASPGHVALAVGMAVYLVILHQIMRQAHGAAMETIKLRFENLDLIEQLRREKSVAEQANLAKSKFLAAASHDLRQPLHALGLFVTALDERIHYPDVKEIVDKIHRCTAALDNLFQGLLDISRLDAGIIEPQLADFALCPLIERLHAEYAPQARDKGLQITFRCGAGAVRSDPALVERILRNLVGNAIRYTHRGGIEMACEARDAQVHISVRDTGMGIAADQQEKVFDEFVQLHNPERDRTKGLGLGLAIVRRLAALLGAEIRLESAPGRGSTFSFALPRAVAAATGAEARDLADEPPPLLDGTTVVVIDDEADVRDGMRTLLEGWGCIVVTDEDAAGAVGQLRARRLTPDVVIADYRLREGATGVEAIARLQDDYGSTLPGLIVTGDTAPERLSEARASGYTLLHKPVPPAKLRALLQNL